MTNNEPTTQLDPLCFYLEYRNDFLTVEGIADWYYIEVETASDLIQRGRTKHEELIDAQ